MGEETGPASCVPARCGSRMGWKDQCAVPDEEASAP